ncbi:MAG: protein phosphatase 2C domain-containing protein [Roseburia sp.]|nr:protein phosphatase 2C domain-containing protein [Ruminococcus sp.]MCM1155998.1 protein phosphatase 2C domain-containing protein [Roseburia sp.]MCM1242792.1 protein phosphatase 2C domain-containing protein [Roseburia sp.]
MGRRDRKFLRKKKEVTVDLGYEKTYQIETPAGCGLLLGKVHGIGRRSKQQDSFGVSELKEENIRNNGILAIVADGMGGLSDGEKASMAATISCLNYFETYVAEKKEINADVLVSMAENANVEVKEVLGESDGSCGSTLIAAYVKDKRLFWLSIGDSHIYLYRDGELTQINKDHNYAAALQEKVEAGELTQEEALCDPQRKALTSYIGIIQLEKIDYNEEALTLLEGDRILLVSDGIYNTLTDEEIIESMQMPAGRSMMHLGMQVEGKRKKNQDNYTALLIEIEE